MRPLRARTIFVMVLALAAVGAIDSPAHAAAVLSNVEIRGHNGRCLDVRGSGTADGTAVQFWGCVGAKQQRWTFYDDGTVRAQHSGKCLTLDINQDGQDLVTRTCGAGLASQRWVNTSLPVPVPNAGGSVSAGKLIRHGNGRCLDVEGPNVHWGTAAQVWTCNPARDNQKFMTAATAQPQWFHDRWRQATNDEVMCFSTSSCTRRDQIREALLFQLELSGIARPPGARMDHRQIGNMATWIAQRTSYSTTEQVYLWNMIARQDSGISIGTTGAHPKVRDSFLSANTYKHTVVPFFDEYHAKKTDLTLQDAFNLIWQHEEDFPGPVVNEGDAEASTRQVIALQRFQATGNSFAEFARYWNGLMRDDNPADWCREQIFSRGCIVVGIPNPLR